ncbi:MAG: prephenate dehydrogenase/arogenate dehydrogenase family protein [Anaerolineae bacterium]|nr:prephenate dehydrogenase/arogenate dehydrogenase family protein [Anaerolineae bacterium]
MTSNQQRITIIGTGCIGTSIGLALRQSRDADHLEIMGHDRDHGRARAAQKMGAFDRAALNLDIALDATRLVIICVPLAQLRQTIGDVARLLEPDAGVVVTSIAPLVVPVQEWAEPILLGKNHFVAGDLFLAPRTSNWEILDSLDLAKPDLCKNAIYAISSTGTENPSALRSIRNLARVLGATPYFMDPVEHDATRILTDALPDLVATALFSSMAESPGWEEVQHAAGYRLATATDAASGDLASRRMLMQLGRDTLLRGVEAAMEHLSRLHNHLAQRDIDALETTLSKAASARDTWILATLDRDGQNESEVQAKDGLFSRTIGALFGEGLAGKQ